MRLVRSLLYLLLCVDLFCCTLHLLENTQESASKEMHNGAFYLICNRYPKVAKRNKVNQHSEQISVFFTIQHKGFNLQSTISMHFYDLKLPFSFVRKHFYATFSSKTQVHSFRVLWWVTPGFVSEPGCPGSGSGQECISTVKTIVPAEPIQEQLVKFKFI